MNEQLGAFYCAVTGSEKGISEDSRTIIQGVGQG